MNRYRFPTGSDNFMDRATAVLKMTGPDGSRCLRELAASPALIEVLAEVEPAGC
jgi:hypothetical protein